MVAPINYSIQVADPFQSALAGLRLGTEIQTARNEQVAAQVAAQQAQERQAAWTQAMTNLRSKPNPTFDDYAAVMMNAPKEQSDAVMKIWQERSKEAQTNELRSIGQVMTALQTNPSVAVGLLRERAAASENSGDKAQAQAYETLAKVAEVSPKEALRMIGITAAALPGAKDMFEAMSKMAGSTGDGYEVLSSEEVEKLGLPKGTVYQRNTSSGKIEVLGAGGARYEMIGPEEAAKLGLPRSGTFQRDVTTGKITAVGGGGVTVNLPPEIGKIPPDYRMVYDDQGRPSSMEVIPGSKTDRELRQSADKAGQAAASTITQSSIVLEEINKLKKMIKNQKLADPVTGTLGAVVGTQGGVLAAGSARKTAEATVQTIKANIGFDRLNQMRQESPTGGALGNITEQELAFLQSVLGSIDLSQKDTAILSNLTRLTKVYEDVIKKAQAYPNAAKYGYAPGAAPAAIDTNTVTVGGKTYSRPANFTDQQWNDYKRAVGVQ